MFQKLFIFVLCVLVLTGGVFRVDAHAETLLVHDCAHNTHFLPDMPMMSMGWSGTGFGIHRAFSGVFDYVQSLAACHCPSLTETQIDEYFGMSIVNVFRAMTQYEDTSHVEFGECEFNFAVDFLAEFAVLDLPTSCTYDNFAAGEACNMEIYLGEHLDISLQITLATCSDDDPFDNALPYFALQCGGVLCEDIMRPCAQDSDCEGGTCYYYEELQDTVESMMIEMMSAVQVFPGDAEQCTYDSINYDPAEAGFGAKVADLMYEGMLGMMGLSGGNVGGGFCSLDRLFNETESGTMEPVSMEGLLDQVDFFSSDDNDRLVLTFGEWDGVLDSGASAVGSDRLAGSAFPNLDVDLSSVAGEVVMLHRTCDNRMSLNPNGNGHISGKFIDFNLWTEGIYGMANTLLQCRSTGEATEQDIEYQFNLMQAGFLLDLFEADSEPENRVFNYLFNSSIRTEVADPDDAFRVDLPSSCDVAQWEAEGRCDIEYDYLSGLFDDEEITLRISLENCPLSNHSLPKFTMICVGDICGDLMEPYTTPVCKQDSDCADAASCTVLEDTQNEFVNIFAEFLYGANTTYGADTIISVPFCASSSCSDIVDPNVTDAAALAVEVVALLESSVYLDGAALSTYDYTIVNAMSGADWWVDVSDDGAFDIIIHPSEAQPNVTSVVDYLTLVDLNNLLSDGSSGNVDFISYATISGYGDTYAPCADGSYDVTGDGCVVDECSDRVDFQWELYNLVMDALNEERTEPVANSIGVGFCQTKWETSLDLENIDTWSEDATTTEEITLASGSKREILYLTGLVEAEVDVCSTCDGGCDSNGNCGEAGYDGYYDIDPAATTFTGLASVLLLTIGAALAPFWH